MGLVKVESSEGITTITMARPEKRNALSQELCDGLYDAYRAFEAGDDLVAILQADGPAFVSAPISRGLRRPCGRPCRTCPTSSASR